MEPIQVVAGILETLEGAWNRGDAVGFGEPFADDAEFIDIRGGYHRGRRVIDEGHAFIFNTIYKGSVVKMRPLDARFITPDVIVAHGTSTLKTQSGMLDGKTALHTLVLVRAGSGWKAAAFHNMIRDDGAPPLPTT